MIPAKLNGMNIEEILTSEKIHLQKMHELVQRSIEEENLLSQKLLESDKDISLTLAQKLADKIADFGGSWKFIISFLFFMFLWMIYNLYFFFGGPFDPYPFILLNLCLSCIAALQAPIIMMSQNRQEEKDRRRAINDYMINLKSELEVRNLHEKIDLLIADQMNSLFEIQKKQLELLDKIMKQTKYQDDQEHIK